MRNRVLSILLALCMTVSLLPGTALAAQPAAEPAAQSEPAAPQAQSPATWRFLFVILKKNNITYRDETGKTRRETTSMSTAEVNAIKFAATNAFPQYFEKNAGTLVKPVVDVVEINTPITKLENIALGPCLNEEGCYSLIRSKVDINKYDQIFAVANLNSIKTSYWGATSPFGFFQGTGYSFINTINKEYCLGSFNGSQVFPCSVFVHEFLHSMEQWNHKRTGSWPVTDLHTFEIYGYDNDHNKQDEYDFYAKYINKTIVSAKGEAVGIDAAAWAAPPVSVRKGIKTATVTFHTNGGYDLPDASRTRVVTSGKAYGTLPRPVRTGYDFVGWFTDRNIQIRASDKVSVTGDQTLYAHWKPKAGSNIYTVTFDRITGALPMKTQAVTYGEAYGDLPAETRAGYTFSGWYTAKTGGKKVTAATKVTTQKDHTLYAHWVQKATVTVTLDPNGGNLSDTEKTLTLTKGSSCSGLPTPVRVGYTFAGWYTAKTGGKKVTEKTTASASQTLYARWVKGRTFLVTFQPNGGTLMQNRTVVMSGMPYRDMPTPVKPDAHFAGWWTAKTGGRQIRPENKVEITANQTLYAHWSKAPVKVDKKENGKWSLLKPAGYEIVLFESESSSKSVGIWFANANSEEFICTRRAELSNGTVRYYCTFNDGAGWWITYTMEMDVK